jgi:hypothetical protein
MIVGRITQYNNVIEGKVLLTKVLGFRLARSRLVNVNPPWYRGFIEQ